MMKESSLSPHARLFDQSNPHWQKTEMHSRMFIDSVMSHLNDLLTSRGHVFLNEVYDMLGMKRSSAGQLVGWLKNDDGDSYINFAVTDVDKNVFVIDFNVDGEIYRAIDEE